LLTSVVARTMATRVMTSNPWSMSLIVYFRILKSIVIEVMSSGLIHEYHMFPNVFEAQLISSYSVF
jgi:hypothetical protein